MFTKKNINKLQNVSELQAELKKRSPWKKLNPDIIDLLGNNANGDAGVLRRFIYISEKEKLTRNYLEITKNKEVFSTPEDHLALFAVTLQRLGIQYFRDLIQQQYGTKQHQINTFATVIAYESAILCNKFLLSAYCQLVGLYAESLIWNDKVKETIELFDKAVDELDKTDDSALCSFNKAVKKNHKEMENQIAEFRHLKP